LPIIGYGAKNIGTLRLWQTESLHEIDFTAFNNQHYAQASADKNKAEDAQHILQGRTDQHILLLDAHLLALAAGVRWGR